MNKNQLVGCINFIEAFDSIKTRFFYVNSETGEVRDVTLELCNAINKFNEVAEKTTAETGQYSMQIPYEYIDGMAEYSHGCGLSHYLQENVTAKIVERNNGSLSFPLEECRISMYTPSDVTHILECENVFDDNITIALKKRFVS